MGEVGEWGGVGEWGWESGGSGGVGEWGSRVGVGREVEWGEWSEGVERRSMS